MTRRPPSPTLFPYTTLFRSLPFLVGGEAETPGLVPIIEPVEDERSEEHTSELQSQSNLVCRLLLEKKKPRRSSRRSQTPCAPLRPRSTRRTRSSSAVRWTSG